MSRTRRREGSLECVPERCVRRAAWDARRARLAGETARFSCEPKLFKTTTKRHPSAITVSTVTSEKRKKTTTSQIPSCGGRSMTHDGLIIPVDTTRTSPSTMTSAVSKNDDTDPARFGLWSLPPDVISTHVLRSDFLPEPADLGRLRAVSIGMRDAVDATGRAIMKLSNRDVTNLGHVSLLKDRHSRGLLKDDERTLVFVSQQRGAGSSRS